MHVHLHTIFLLFQAKLTTLIQLYIIGVFVSFSLGQIGMVRHWNRHLAVEKDVPEQRRMMRCRAINAVGAAMSGASSAFMPMTL